MSSEPPKQDKQLPQEQPQAPQRTDETPRAEPARQAQVRIAQFTQEQWSGPIPPPAVLQKLNEVIPDGAERVFRLAEKEQSHRIKLESEGLSAAKGDTRRGQYLGAAISLTAIVGAVVAAFMGAHPSVPVALVGVPVFAIVNAIVNRRSNSRR